MLSNRLDHIGGGGRQRCNHPSKCSASEPLNEGSRTRVGKPLLRDAEFLLGLFVAAPIDRTEGNVPHECGNVAPKPSPWRLGPQGTNTFAEGEGSCGSLHLCSNQLQRHPQSRLQGPRANSGTQGSEGAGAEDLSLHQLVIDGVVQHCERSDQHVRVGSLVDSPNALRGHMAPDDQSMHFFPSLRCHLHQGLPSVQRDDYNRAEGIADEGRSRSLGGGDVAAASRGRRRHCDGGRAALLPRMSGGRMNGSLRVGARNFVGVDARTNYSVKLERQCW
mmetsp:Transcript_11461/g.17280  ORF Transcript_11461/g.17280 Transcript_11461/m.17280 type:complete len:276 (+) Transcript_11461:281-1108(+)